MIASSRTRTRSTVRLLACALGVAMAAAAPWTGAAGTEHGAGHVPTPDHVVVAVMENHAYGQIIGSPSAPYINSWGSHGAVLTSSYAIAHPSQPNYFALFSGATQGITDDSCYIPGFRSTANLASELTAVGKTWASYSESLPSQGSATCGSGRYARTHNPWFGFGNVPRSSAKTFAQFPTVYARLPTVSFVIPNLCSDMHDCPVSTGDTWLETHLGAYAAWAKTHNSLLIVTFDEGNKHSKNKIATVLYGQPVAAGSRSATRYDHYDVLRTIEDMYGTSHAGHAATASDITGIWAS